jgi:hypothetical protein
MCDLESMVHTHIEYTVTYNVRELVGKVKLRRINHPDVKCPGQTYLPRGTRRGAKVK